MHTPAFEFVLIGARLDGSTSMLPPEAHRFNRIVTHVDDFFRIVVVKGISAPELPPPPLA